MTSTFHDAPTYQFTEKIEGHVGDEDFKCMADTAGGMLCVGDFNDEVRYYPDEDRIRDKDGKPYKFVHLEMKLDKLVIDDKVYDYVQRVYVNYDPNNPNSRLKSGSTSPYAHGVDILRFIAAYDGKIELDEIMVNPKSPLNKKGELNYPLVWLKQRKDTNLEDLLSSENYNVTAKEDSFNGKRLLKNIEKLEKSIPSNDKYEAQPVSFGVVGGIFYKDTDIEGNAIKKGQTYPFRIDPLIEFGGEPSLEDFKHRSENLDTLFENAKFYNIPDNKISFRTAFLGRLYYLVNKKPKWDLLNGGHIEGSYEWGTKVHEISNDFFRKAITMSTNPDKFDREAVEVLKHMDISDDRMKLERDVENLIEDLEERDYEFPGSFLTEAAKLERELSDGKEDLEKLLEKYNLLKEKVDNFKEAEDEAEDEYWKEYQEALGELKILADIAMRTKKKSDHEAYLEKMNKISEDFSETSYIKELNRNVSKVTFEDSDRPLRWKELTKADLESEGSILAQKRTPILLEEPSENELDTPKEDPYLILDVADDNLYYGTKSEIINRNEKVIPIPSKAWVFVEAPSKATYTNSSDYDVSYGSGNPRNTSNEKPTFDPNTEGDDLWDEYIGKENPRVRRLWYKRLRNPKQKTYLKNRHINLHVQRYNRLDSGLEKIDYLSKLKADDALTYTWVMNALGVDLKAFNSVITQYRKPRNLAIDTQTNRMIAQLFGEEIPNLNVAVSEKKYDNSEENIQALNDLKEALKNEEDISNVFLDNKKSEKDYKFIFPDGRVISLNVIRGVQALIRRYKIKHLEKVNDPQELIDANEKYKTRISAVDVIIVDVNGKDHLGVTLTTGGGSVKFTLPDTNVVRNSIEAARNIAKENSKDTFVAPRGEEKRPPRTLAERLDAIAEDIDPENSYYQETADGEYIIVIPRGDMPVVEFTEEYLSDEDVETLADNYIEFKEGIYNES